MNDEKYMARCIQLAKNGQYHTAPNPMVGAVLVCNDKIIGEGFHAQFGQAHAEVNAIQSVKDQALLPQSTLYVNLEPCSHQGKTPPCTDLIIKSGIKKVVVGCADPFEKVSGRGIQKLREAGCEVVTGVLEEDCKELNKKFITFHTKHRPFITLKWAQSADGFLDVIRPNGSHPTLLSSEYTQLFVHKLRAEHMAVLVGYRTARLDNPQLNLRYWDGVQPIRVVIDRHIGLPSNLHLFDGKQRTIVFTAQECGNMPNWEFQKIDFNKDTLPQILEVLAQKNIISVMVEGGSITLQKFIDAGLWDEAYVENCPQVLKAGVKAPVFKDVKNDKNIYILGRKYHISYNFS